MKIAFVGQDQSVMNNKGLKVGPSTVGKKWEFGIFGKILGEIQKTISWAELDQVWPPLEKFGQVWLFVNNTKQRLESGS